MDQRLWWACIRLLWWVDVVDSAYVAPADYSQLFRDHYGYVVGLVGKMGVPRQEAPDVASNIFAYLIEADVLAQYNPEHVVEHQGEQRRTKFRTFLSAKVGLYVRGQRDKLTRLATREQLLLDAPAEGEVAWHDLLGAWWDDYTELDDPEFLERMRTYLALSEPPEPGQPALLALFDLLAAEVQETGTFTRRRVCEGLGLDPADARDMVSRLREELGHARCATVTKLRHWTIGGVRVGVPEVRQAVEILEATSDYRIQPYLEKAGHPLRLAAAKWYIPFSREERKLHPGITAEPAPGCVRAGAVKAAVLHRLRRMLAEEADFLDGPAGAQRPDQPELPDVVKFPQVSEVDELPSPLDLIEFEFRRLGAGNDQVAYVLSLVEAAAREPAVSVA